MPRPSRPSPKRRDRAGLEASEPSLIRVPPARFAAERRLAYVGAHHEIYLGDPRRTAPERLRTILRHPVRRGAAPRPRRT